MHSSFGPNDPKYARSEALSRKITEYKAWLNAGEYRWLMMIREFDQEGLWKLDGIHSCAHWLQWKCGIGMNAAREKVRVANALGGLPRISAEYSRGELSYSKVRAITRIATPDNENYLLMIARHGTVRHVEELVAKYRRCQRLAESKNAVDQHARREFHYRYEDDGTMSFRGRFPAEQGELILKALELAMAQSEAEVKAERKHLIEAAKESGDAVPTNGNAEEPVYYSDASEDVRPYESFEVTRADALSVLAESYLANGPKASTTADRYQVIIHASATTLATNPPPETLIEPPVGARHAGDHDHDRQVPPTSNPPAETPPNPPAETPDIFTTDFSYLENGPHIAAETARRIACDASLIRLIDDENGEPLSIGRKSRVVPPAMARALRIRDDGCRFPGCTHKHFIDRHHIKHWAKGGETSMANLVQLCRYHHRLVHEHGFGCERTDNDRIVFTNPNGKVIGYSCTLPPVPPDDDPVDWLKTELDELDLHVDGDTGVTLWRGEKIDWPLAVGHLFDS